MNQRMRRPRSSAVTSVHLLALLMTLLACSSCSAFQVAPSSRLRSESTRVGLFDMFKPPSGGDNGDGDGRQGKDKKAEESATAAPASEYDEDDPVEKMFGMFFGKKEAEPMGMKRFGRERFPEQYPAVLDQWADPVESDTKEMALVRPMLKNTNLESRALKMTYKASRDGWSAEKFHQRVDKLGGGLVVATLQDGLVCGGYNPKGWVGYGEARGSIAAFLFVFKDGLEERPTKLRKVGGPSLAQQDLPELGPSFGADSLVIPMNGRNAGDRRIARSKLGSYYERFPNGTNTLFGVKRGSSVPLKDVVVYHGIYEEGEYIPFTDAEPFALY